MSFDEISRTRSLALGRIFSILSRPTREGDDAEYEAARNAFLSTCDAVGGYVLPPAASVLAKHKAIFGD